MKKSIWCCEALILLWFCGIAGCQEKTENLPVAKPALSHSIGIMPVRNNEIVDDSSDDAIVFVCQSSGAKRYHLNRECSSLKKCKHDIEESNTTNAENIGLTLCKYED